MVALVLPLSSIINYDTDKPIQLVYNRGNSDVVMGEEGLGQRTRFHLPRVRINTSLMLIYKRLLIDGAYQQ